MKFGITKKLGTTLLALTLAGLFSQVSMADQASAQKTIAGILSTMNHFPSDAQKLELQAIIDDASSGQGMQMIAGAIMNMQHAATAEGKAAMEQIMGYDQAPQPVKDLAKVVHEFNHMASAEAKEVLAKL